MKKKKVEEVIIIQDIEEVTETKVVSKTERDYSKVGCAGKRKIQIYEAMGKLGSARQRKLDYLLSKI